MEIMIMLWCFFQVKVVFSDEQTELTNELLARPLSHYKLKLKAKFKEKVVPLAAKPDISTDLQNFHDATMMLKTKENQIDKPSIFLNITKTLSKKPTQKLKPTGIKKYATIKPLELKIHKENDTTSNDVERYEDNLSFNEDTDFTNNIFTELWEDANQEEDKSLYESIINQQRLTAEKLRFKSTEDISLDLYRNAKEITIRPTKPTVTEEPSMFDETNYDSKNNIGPRPIQMSKNKREKTIELLKIQLKDPEKATSLKTELEQTYKDNSNRNKPNASIFEEPFSMIDPEETFRFWPIQRPNTDKQLLKLLVEREIVNKTWLLNKLGISTQPSVKENSTEFSIVQNLEPKTENSFTVSNTEEIIYGNSTYSIVHKEKDSASNKIYTKERNRNKITTLFPRQPINRDENATATQSNGATKRGLILFPESNSNENKMLQPNTNAVYSHKKPNSSTKDSMHLNYLKLAESKNKVLTNQSSSSLSSLNQNSTLKSKENAIEKLHDGQGTDLASLMASANVVNKEEIKLNNDNQSLLPKKVLMNLTNKYYKNVMKAEKILIKNRRTLPLFTDIDNYFKNLDNTTAVDITLPRNEGLAAKTLKDIENLYKSNQSMYPNRTCGIDNSPVNIVYEGSGKLETYPWLGILFYPLENKRLTTSVVLVTKQIVIGSAMDVHKLPKVDFRERARVVLGRSCSRERLRVLDYNYHPEYRSDTYNALVIVQLDLTSSQHELRPICAPPAVLTEAIFHAMVLPQDCKSTKIKIYEMVHVSPEECKHYYRRSGLDIKSLWPKHTACGRARWGGECVWRSGAALVVKQNGRWHLLGFGVHGPGCEAPARFVDYGMYRRWVADSVARVGRPAVTRLGPNHLVLRRTTFKIQRFGICDKGEVLHELFTDETRIGTGVNDPGKVRYNLTIFANSEYACVTFKAWYEPETGISAKPRVFLRRHCPNSSPICHTGGILHVDFYVEIVYIHPLTFKVLAYGQEAKIVDHKSLMKYANLKRKFPDQPAVPEIENLHI